VVKTKRNGKVPIKKRASEDDEGGIPDQYRKMLCKCSLIIRESHRCANAATREMVAKVH